jgi:dipeptidyl aminopeptidase/acylaminoacyl peptidase
MRVGCICPRSSKEWLSAGGRILAPARTDAYGYRNEAIMTERLPYGSWRSPVTSDLIVGETIGLATVLVDGADIYWVEARPSEAGRNVLVRRAPDGATQDITPAPFNARTRVHEYGGGAVTIGGGLIYFSNFVDQRLYRRTGGGAPEPITPAPEENGSSWRYADGRIDARRGRWIGVREEHRADGNVVNTLVEVEPGAGAPGRVLAEGCDFYTAPRLSPDGTHLAWLSWNHPHMPWVSTELWLARIADDGSLAEPKRVAGGPREAICQPEWMPDGSLIFVSDRTGWWNLYRCDVRGDGAVRPLCPREAEFGRAHWIFDWSSYSVLTPDRLACSYREAGRGWLGLLDMTRGVLEPIETGFAEFGWVRAVADGRIVCIAGSPTEPLAIVAIDPNSGRTEVLRRSSAPPGEAGLRGYLSVPRHLEFPTEGGRTAFANYYPPANPEFAAPDGERPPLLVKCHGGPTAGASSVLDLRTQFWTSRGIAVLDVNYGGSTGYGRAYRDRLEGQWGVVDVDDCINAARHAVAEGLADGARAVITGGSAGGYTVLSALTRGEVFKGGASYYGVSDVAALARDTHKFESRYLDWLIGPYPERADLYRERSPLTHAENLNYPVIFFQGDEDRIVPPNQTAMMGDALRRRGIPVGYLLFAGEQHGFRQADNIKRALDAELYFYAALVFRTRLGF